MVTNYMLPQKRYKILVEFKLGFTHRLQSSSFLGLPYRILNIKPQKGTTLEPLGLSVGLAGQGRGIETPVVGLGFRAVGL